MEATATEVSLMDTVICGSGEDQTFIAGPIQLETYVDTVTLQHKECSEPFDEIDRSSYSRDQIEYLKYIYYVLDECLDELETTTEWSRSDAYTFTDPQDVFSVSLTETDEGWTVESTENIINREFPSCHGKQLAGSYLCYAIETLDPRDMALQVLYRRASREVVGDVLSSETIQSLHKEDNIFIEDMLQSEVLTEQQKDLLQEKEGDIETHRTTITYKKKWFVEEL